MQYRAITHSVLLIRS